MVNWNKVNLGFVGRHALDFTTNEGETDQWATVLNLEVPQHLIYKFLAGTAFSFRLPTADQDQGVDIDSPDTHTVSLSNQIIDIPDADKGYQAIAFIDGSKATISAIDETNNEIDVDVSGSGSTDSDVTVFYLPSDLGQMVRFRVKSTSSPWRKFHSDDLGLLHQIFQRDNAVKHTLDSDARAPRYFKIQVQVNSSIAYYTSTDQSSDFNQSVSGLSIAELNLRANLADYDDYVGELGTTKAEVKQAVMTKMANN